ncbi:MAG: SDR family oxidoreductase [Sphingomicrobium sp.]
MPGTNLLDRSLSGRRALVTGGGSGLGFVFADALAEAGADLIICGRRSGVVEEAAEKLRSHGGKVEARAADVSRPEEIESLKQKTGAIDILINNAGYSIRKQSWLEVTAAEWQEVLAINLMAPFLLAQAFAPAMVAAGFGRIVNLSSVYGVVASNPDHYPDMPSDNTSYVASKHALIGLTKNLAMRVAGSGVTVNTISPGIFPDLSKRERADGSTAGQKTGATLLQNIPMHRFGKAEDLRGTIVFIAGLHSAYITGQTFVVDGGFTIS